MTDWIRPCSDGACLEYRTLDHLPAFTWLRDSEHPSHEVAFPTAAWEAFLAAVRAPVEAERDNLGSALKDMMRGYDPLLDRTEAAEKALADVQPVLDAARAYVEAWRVLDRYTGDGGDLGEYADATVNEHNRLLAALDDYDRKAPSLPASMAEFGATLADEERAAFEAAGQEGSASPPESPQGDERGEVGGTDADTPTVQGGVQRAACTGLEGCPVHPYGWGLDGNVRTIDGRCVHCGEKWPCQCPEVSNAD